MENMKYKVRVTKCYLVQVLDEEDNEVDSEYVFADRKSFAEAIGRQMIERHENRTEEPND